MPNPLEMEDPRKQSEEMHKKVSDIAKAVSDTFYKVDSTLLGLPPNNAIAEELKAIRDNIFVQKQRAEKLLAGASQALAELPPAPPPEPEPEPEPEPAEAPAPVATPHASTPPPQAPPAQNPAKTSAHIIADCMKAGQIGNAGVLTTDGEIVYLHTDPIFKMEGQRLFASWGGQVPTESVCAHVNNLAAAFGLSDVFTIQKDRPMVKGKQASDLQAWVELGAIPQAKSSGGTGLPSLLCPRI